MEKRKILLYATKGGAFSVEIENGITWSDIYPIADQHYNMSNLEAVESKNKTVLSHMDAVIPDGDLTIFLKPISSKSGHISSEDSFKRLREEVKDLEDSGRDVKEYLNGYISGKNWTQLNREDLYKGIKAYLDLENLLTDDEVGEVPGEYEEDEDIQEDEDNAVEEEIIEEESEELERIYNHSYDENEEILQQIGIAKSIEILTNNITEDEEGTVSLIKNKIKNFSRRLKSKIKSIIGNQQDKEDLEDELEREFNKIKKGFL